MAVDSDDLWDFYAELAATYYVAARFAADAQYYPMTGNLAHHAVEMLLKAGLLKAGAVKPAPSRWWVPTRLSGRWRFPIKVETVETVLKKYRHSLKRLWRDFKVEHTSVDLSTFDQFIRKVDKWEEVRYPRRGFVMTAEWSASSPPLPPPSGIGMAHVRQYTLNIETLDQWFQQVWSLASISNSYFHLRAHTDTRPVAKAMYELHNVHQIKP